MSATFEARTYRGASLEELLPKIREELGPEAVITRQREGVVGGIGGFFGKRCIEIEAEGAPAPALPPIAPAFAPPLPTRAVVDLYDSGENWRPSAGLEPEEEPQPEDNALLRMVIGQSAPFVDELEAAFARDEPEPQEEPAAPVVVPPETAAVAAPPASRALAAPSADLGTSGLPVDLAAELELEVAVHARPFEPDAEQADLLRSALARRLRVRHGWRARRRTIALVGAAGSGKTLAVAKLCRAYAEGAGLEVAALSLAPVREALRLAALTEGMNVTLEAADSADAVSLVAARTRSAALVVVDTPAVAVDEPGRLEELARLLAALRPDEIHLVLPAGEAGAARLLDALRAGGIAVDRLLITHAGEHATAGVAVGLSLTARLPISYIGSGDDVRVGLHPADPCDAARLVIP